MQISSLKGPVGLIGGSLKKETGPDHTKVRTWKQTFLLSANFRRAYPLSALQAPQNFPQTVC